MRHQTSCLSRVRGTAGRLCSLFRNWKQCPWSGRGSIAPDFTLKSLDGREVSLSDFRGSVVFLNFWRTDCVPCAAEMPDMEAFRECSREESFR